MIINLSSNQLNSDSFERGSLSQIKRPTQLILSDEDYCSNKNFTYLKEDVFVSFLACGNTIIDLGACKLQCDESNMKWLIDSPVHWRNRIMSNKIKGRINCQDGKSLFEEMKLNYFSYY